MGPAPCFFLALWSDTKCLARSPSLTRCREHYETSSVRAFLTVADTKYVQCEGICAHVVGKHHQQRTRTELGNRNDLLTTAWLIET